MALILDEAWQKVDPVAARNAGYTGIIGYVSQDTSGKNLTRSDIDKAHAAGFDVGFVYEYAPASARGGSAHGATDAGIAVAHAQSLGVPAGVALYAAVDFDATESDMPSVLAYANAFKATVGAHGYRSGVYGSFATCWFLRQHGYVGLLWQTYAWSHGQWANGVNVRQTRNGISVAGKNVDQDETQTSDWGQWPAVGTPGHIGGAIEVSNLTDNIVASWSQGIDHTTKDDGSPFSVEPVKWRVRDEAWQASITAALSAVAAAVAKLGTATGGLTDEEAADLHTVASALGKLTG